MKTAIKLLIVLLSQNILQGQNYEPVITNDSISWDIARWELFGIHMFKLNTQKHPDSIFTELYSDIYLSPLEYMGKIREDQSTGRMWYKDPFYNTEHLIMDMTLTIADTFEIQPGQWSTVDSVFYYDGRKIIRFNHASGWNEKIMFIEGVGPNISVIYRYDSFIPFYATCKYHNHEQVYVNSNDSLFDGCLPDATGIDTPSKILDFKLYPNPCKDKLNIQINPSFQNQSELHIIDVKGRIIKSFKLAGYNHTIDLRSYKKGIHFIRITNGDYILIRKLLLTH